MPDLFLQFKTTSHVSTAACCKIKRLQIVSDEAFISCNEQGFVNTLISSNKIPKQFIKKSTSQSEALVVKIYVKQTKTQHQRHSPQQVLIFLPCGQHGLLRLFLRSKSKQDSTSILSLSHAEILQLQTDKKHQSVLLRCILKSLSEAHPSQLFYGLN